MAAIYYFITALFVLLVCFNTYFALPLMKFYRYYNKNDERPNEKQFKKQERPPYIQIIRKTYPQLLNVFITFFVTLAIFPAVHAGIRPVNENFFTGTRFFTVVTCFITFNFFAMLGSCLPIFVLWPSPKYLWVPCYLRLLYIPFFVLCNYQVENIERVMPVVVKSDWLYWIVGATMAFSSGYFSSLGMIYTPKLVEDQYAPVAGMLSAAVLVTGIFAGILITFCWPWVISNIE